jgi:hypothetical protein
MLLLVAGTIPAHALDAGPLGDSSANLSSISSRQPSSVTRDAIVRFQPSPSLPGLAGSPFAPSEPWEPSSLAIAMVLANEDTSKAHRSALEAGGRTEPATTSPSIWRELFACDAPLTRVWSFEFSVGVVSDNTLADYLDPKFVKLRGPGGGVTYNFTVTRRLYQFHWNIGGITLRPELEVPARLTLVDENSGRVIPDFNLGVAVRWRDFPWNKFVRTTLAAGPGLSYSVDPWTGDYQRHPEDPDRSRLKFWLPIELTLALPCFPQHQLVGFIDHQSGGRMLDRGGVDAWGLGYRLEF